MRFPWQFQWTFSGVNNRDGIPGETLGNPISRETNLDLFTSLQSDRVPKQADNSILIVINFDAIQIMLALEKISNCFPFPLSRTGEPTWTMPHGVPQQQRHFRYGTFWHKPISIIYWFSPLYCWWFECTFSMVQFKLKVYRHIYHFKLYPINSIILPQDGASQL